LRPGGVFYFTSNFDGEIILEPAIDDQLDDDLPRMLCAAMSAGTTDGRGRINSRIGRQLFHAVKRAGGDVMDMGSSDWTIFPGPDGYDADEEYFLHHLIHFISHTLIDSSSLDSQALAAWVEQRHRQIDEAQLVYISHQLDILGRVPGAEPGDPTL
jgi:hypothetical protein